MTSHGRSSCHIAIAEANNFHEETIFALATAAREAAPDARLTVFAPDHWKSRSFLLTDMRMSARWLPFAALDAWASGPEPDIDLLLVNTYPSPAGQQQIERNLGRARAVFGLMHDPGFLAAGAGAAALRQHEGLTLAYLGPAMPDAAAARRRDWPPGRVIRWIPVLRPRPASALRTSDDGTPPQRPRGAPSEKPRRRSGIALPGALEFARRDYALAFEFAARANAELRIFGRSKDQGDGPARPRDLDKDRQQMMEAIARFGLADRVELAMDVSCREFYRTVERSRWVAVLPNQEDYLRGKLTGAVTAAVSCAVPMLASAPCHAYYTTADPEIFSGCMVSFEASAAAGTILGGGPHGDTAYQRLSTEAGRAREALIGQNASVIARLLGR